MHRCLLTLLAAALFAQPAPVHAADTDDLWVKCDGFSRSGKTKGKKGGLMGAILLGSGGFAAPARPQKAAKGMVGAAACTSLLASPELATLDWSRKPSLLKARAIHFLEDGRPEEALADVTAARTLIAAGQPSLHFERSTGLALDLVEAFALVSLGRDAEAVERAQAATRARPWSLRVQTVTMVMMSVSPQGEASVLQAARRIDQLDDGGAANLWPVYIRTGALDRAALLARKQLDAAVPQDGKTLDLGPVMNGVTAAFILARTGKGAEVPARLTQIREHVQTAEFLKATSGTQFGMPLALLEDKGQRLRTQILSSIAKWDAPIAAATAFSAGDAAGAQDALAGALAFPSSELLIDLVTDLQARIPVGERKGIVAMDAARLRETLAWTREDTIRRITNLNFIEILPQAEDEERLNSFGQRDVLGFRQSGFRDSAQPDGTTRIQYVGTISSAIAVEEMTLLRAALFALDAGKPGFVIEKRSDFERILTRTYRGTPIGTGQPIGFTTELTIRLVDDLAGERAIPADEVKKALAPIYAPGKAG